MTEAQTSLADSEIFQKYIEKTDRQIRLLQEEIARSHGFTAPHDADRFIQKIFYSED